MQTSILGPINKKRNGFTMLEMLIAVFIAAAMLTCTMSMLVATLKSCDADIAQSDTDTTAVTAMQYMISDVREANSFNILYSGSHLRVIPPVTINDGTWYYYDRTKPDTSNQINYYLSDATGTVGQTGNCLWRSKGGSLLCICTNVDSLLFTADSSYTNNAIMITVRTKDQIYKGTRQTELTQRLVYLRNKT